MVSDLVVVVAAAAHQLATPSSEVSSLGISASHSTLYLCIAPVFTLVILFRWGVVVLVLALAIYGLVVGQLPDAGGSRMVRGLAIPAFRRFRNRETTPVAVNPLLLLVPPGPSKENNSEREGRERRTTPENLHHEELCVRKRNQSCITING